MQHSIQQVPWQYSRDKIRLKDLQMILIYLE